MFMPDRISASRLDAFARALAPVRQQSSHGANMPAGLTFFEGWGVRRAEEIDAPKLWRESRPMKSLATRIGVRENGDPFYFDVHEKSMGPHGLVAGTTGSGKSEALTTWLLSMALSFSPLDVNFFLIDFKGDGLAGVLKELPHVAGTVGNLSEASVIIRALRSLDGELKRRQHIFSGARVKNIQSYQEAFHKGKVSEPMAYLLIVIDEFAEMHTQFPELADQFISVARTGRSLGIYLTLTMQSPGGVVKGQVESNLNFRIVLRTSGPGESREALGTPDAASISKRTPGRAWIRSGEIYELVQTFYSAASYNPASGTRDPSAKIHVVAEDGERILPEVYEKTVKAKGADDTEGAAVARYIKETAKNEGGLLARPVWTQPLPENMFLSTLLSGREAFRDGEWQPRNEGMSVAVGLVDDPENQTQYPLFLDFIKNGHYALYGAPSSGKTTFLQTALMSAALSYTPDQVRFLVLDFGTWGLKLFERLPHTILVADANDAERVKKTEEYLLSELASRKRKFAEEGVGAMKDYTEVTGNTLPAILAVVDNMAALHSQYPDVLDTLIDIAREGGNLGLYLILTASGQGSFMYKISQYIKVSIALQLTDRSEYRGLVGGDGRQEPTKFPGRGFVKGPLEFQTAIGAEGVRQRRDMCDEMRAAWGDATPVIYDAADEIDTASLAIAYEYAQIGIEKETRSPYDFVFADMNGCVISGAPQSGKTNLLGRIVSGLLEDEKTTVYLYEKGSALESLRGNGKLTAAHDGAGIDAMVSELLDEYFRRVGYDTNSPRLALCIDDFVAAFGDISNDKVDALNSLILYGGDFGIYTYITGDITGLVKFSDMLVEPFARCMGHDRAVAIGGRLADHRIFSEIYGGSGNERLPEYEARILRGGQTRRVKLAKFAGGAEAQVPGREIVNA
jgi:S-DNA-T family DNA segregation ATPase FtsK/SpoIIIE